MNQSLLERTLTLPNFFIATTSVYIITETFRTYRTISKEIEKVAMEKGTNLARIAAKEGLESIKKQNWLYRNVLNAGVVWAYERFLSRFQE